MLTSSFVIIDFSVGGRRANEIWNSLTKRGVFQQSVVAPRSLLQARSQSFTSSFESPAFNAFRYSAGDQPRPPSYSATGNQLRHAGAEPQHGSQSHLAWNQPRLTPPYFNNNHVSNYGQSRRFQQRVTLYPLAFLNTNNKRLLFPAQ